MRKRSVSSVRGARVGVNARRTTQKIDFSDIPDSSPDQLKAMRRVGRPPLGSEPRQPALFRRTSTKHKLVSMFRREALEHLLCSVTELAFRFEAYQTCVSLHAADCLFTRISSWQRRCSPWGTDPD